MVKPLRVGPCGRLIYIDLQSRTPSTDSDGVADAEHEYKHVGPTSDDLLHVWSRDLMEVKLFHFLSLEELPLLSFSALRLFLFWFTWFA